MPFYSILFLLKLNLTALLAPAPLYLYFVLSTLAPILKAPLNIKIHYGCTADFKFQLLKISVSVPVALDSIL